MHRTYLADVERGVRNLSLSSIARLVGAIGVSLSEFFGVLERLDLSTVNNGRGGNVKASRGRKKAKAPARGRSSSRGGKR